MKNIRYYVVSPDGFPIEYNATYPTPKTAWAAFELWRKRYENQGYYSTYRNGKRLEIRMKDLKSECSLKEFKEH